MLRQAKLVCIIGTDGAGKTTQARRLQDHLRADGREVEYAWGKYGSEYTKRFIELIKRVLDASGKDMDDHSSRSETKDSFLANPAVRVTYLMYMLTIYYVQLLRRVVVPVYTSDVLVCDRYVHDTIVDIMVDYEYSGERGRTMLRVFQALLPEPDHVVFIDVPVDVSLERKDDIPTEEYITQKRRAYDELLAELDVPTIDGTQSRDEVFEELRTRVTDSHTTTQTPTSTTSQR